jgi:mRNA (2'-O-methyladenosine-N6-)-methyltransferase
MSSSRLQELREKSRKRKELLKHTLGVENLAEALGTEKHPRLHHQHAATSASATSGTGSASGMGAVRSPEKKQEQEYRDSTAFLKGTQSLNPHNDYSQNFVDTGQRPQNFIRDTGLTGRFEEYPKLQELIRLKDELIARTAHPPMYLKCDLETYDLVSGNFAQLTKTIIVIVR